jgi:hypothetical protein
MIFVIFARGWERPPHTYVSIATVLENGIKLHRPILKTIFVSASFLIENSAQFATKHVIMTLR